MLATAGGWLQHDRPDTASGATTINVPIASASTKKEWIEEAIQTFNSLSRSHAAFQVDGTRVVVTIIREEIEPGRFDHYRSGTMVDDVESEKIRPVAVSPGEDTWLAKLNNDWKAAHGKEIISGTPSALLQTPIVVAMWQSRAVALGCWPVALPECTWRRLSELAASPTGWA